MGIFLTRIGCFDFESMEVLVRYWLSRPSSRILPSFSANCFCRTADDRLVRWSGRLQLLYSETGLARPPFVTFESGCKYSAHRHDTSRRGWLSTSSTTSTTQDTSPVLPSDPSMSNVTLQFGQGSSHGCRVPSCLAAKAIGPCRIQLPRISRTSGNSAVPGSDRKFR